jgi:hypothetical protein
LPAHPGSLILVGRGQITGRECASRLRDAVREHNQANGTSWRVAKLPRRGKGSHDIWAVFEGETVRAQAGVTMKMGDTVRNRFIAAFVTLFNDEGWF